MKDQTEQTVHTAADRQTIRAAFFDVDGTLLSHELKDVPESAVQTVRSIQNNGILCAAATGRSMMEYERLPVSRIKMDAYVTLNGQLVLDREGSILAEHPIEREAREALDALFAEKEIPVLFVEKDRMYISFINDDVIRAQKAISTPLPETGIPSENPVYLAIGFVDEHEAQKLKKRLPGCRMTRWNSHAVDIISEKGSKLAGIEELLKQYGLNISQAIGFGDGENDLEMITHLGTGVAMGNADEEVKAAADFVTRTVEEGGIEYAAKSFHLIDEKQ